MWGAFSRANLINPAQRHRSRLVAREVARWAPRTIVDLGCGAGHLLSQLAKAAPGARCVGIDAEARAIELARQVLNDPQLVVGNLEDEHLALPKALEGRADVVVCSEVLEHLGRPDRAVRLARRLLAPGRPFIATVPAGPMTRFDHDIGHKRHYTVDSLGALVIDAGFEVERIFSWGFPFHTLFRVGVGLAPRAAGFYENDRLSGPARLVLHLLYYLFFLNFEHRRFGRQLVVVAR